ncbi:MAG TPA: hypothetical protein VND93_02425 [Myxococcales bacterium]|nr:hypothetical protein [Myxococcales bacterium]
MKRSTSSGRWPVELLRVAVLASALLSLLSPRAATAQTQGQTPPGGTAATATSEAGTGQPSPEEARRRETWNLAMMQKPTPKKGCFRSTYPKTDWEEVSCTATPDYPMPPRRGPRPLTVGNGDDVSAQVVGAISQAIGTFDSVTNVTSESSPIGNSGTPVANAYTLQMNTNFFVSTTCSGSPNAGCRGWEQFVFENYGSGARAFIQYWLLRYNTTCPAGWNQFSFTGSTDIYCYRNNSLGAVGIPAQPITNLANLRLTGTVSATADSVAVSTGVNVYSVNGDNSVNAAAGWQIAEFNVFGDGGNSSGGGAATFNAGASMVPRVRVISGSNAPPTCTAQGFTGETNNLSFGPTAPGVSPPGPALRFAESTAGGAASNCAAATSVGDTHLATVGGLFYDFQASGDFVLAEVDPDFVVQARQVSGAPPWPDATVNQAVATRMGKTQVAICLGKGDPRNARLLVDGKATEIGDGQSLALPEGVDLVRVGDAYTIMGPDGDSVRAVVHPTWINVFVGFGRWPAPVRGLIANANGNVNQIAARDGTVLTSPFPFADLYRRIGESWRVAPRESLLAVCGGEPSEVKNPSRPFFANDLEPGLRERSRATCAAAGVKPGPLLDACTLDVAVIGNAEAAKVFAGLPSPVSVGTPPPGGFSGQGMPRWIWWLVLLAILIALILWLLRRKP